MSGPGLDARQITEFLDEVSPGVTEWLVIDAVGDHRARVRVSAGPERLRPGGIVAGPVLMSLVDAAVWVAVLGVVGPVPMAVTANLNVSFLRPAPPGDVIADAQLHKVGKRLAVGEVLVTADGDAAAVAVATVTYALPSKR